MSRTTRRESYRRLYKPSRTNDYKVLYMKTLLKGAFVVSMDPDVGDIDGGDILLEDGLIAAVGRGLSPIGAEVIDAAGCIALPGFVDAHRHLWEGAMRVVTADWSILDFVGNIRLHAAQFLRPRDMYATSFHGALEALNAGVTTVAEYCHNARSAEHVTQSIAGVRAAGLRTVWGYSFTGLMPGDNREGGRDGEVAFVKALAAEQFLEPGLLTLGICLEEPMHWREGAVAVRGQVALARKLGAQMFMHANSVPRSDGSLEREVDRLDAIGALGPDLTLIHMGFTAPDEWSRLGETGGHVVFTPETELQMGLGWPAISEAGSAGVNIGLGTDITANNSADLFNQTRMALQVERGRQMAQHPGRQFRTRTPLDARSALHWATLGSAAACGLADRVGSLTPGKEADIVLLRADDITLAGWDRRNPAGTIVQQAGVHNVEVVLVAGRVVKRDGRLVANAANAVRALEETSAHVHARVAETGGFDAPQDVLYRRLGIDMGVDA